MSTPQQYRSGVKHRPAKVAYPGGQNSAVSGNALFHAMPCQLGIAQGMEDWRAADRCITHLRSCPRILQPWRDLQCPAPSNLR